MTRFHASLMPDAQRFEKSRHHVIGSDRSHELGHRPSVEMLGDRIKQCVRYLHVTCHRVGQREDRSLKNAEGLADLRQFERGELFLAHARVPGNGKMRLELDRKSTRLNSSHGYISYAVFCLKKKK